MQYSGWRSTQADLQFVLLQNASSPTVAAAASDWGSNIGRVAYSYKVEGIKYRGRRIMPLQSVYLPRETVVNLRKGAVTVSYNPSDPSQSFIYAVIPVTQLIMLLMGGTASLFLAFRLPKLIGMFAHSISYER